MFYSYLKRRTQIDAMALKSLTLIEAIVSLIIITLTVTGVLTAMTLSRKQAGQLESQAQLTLLGGSLLEEIFQSTAASPTSSCDNVVTNLCYWEQFESPQVLDSSFFQDHFSQLSLEVFDSLASSSYLLTISKIGANFDRQLPSTSCPYLDQGCTYETCPGGESACTYKNFLVTLTEQGSSSSYQFEVFKEVS